MKIKKLFIDIPYDKDYMPQLKIENGKLIEYKMPIKEWEEMVDKIIKDNEVLFDILEKL